MAKKVLPGGKPKTVKKMRRWKADADGIFGMLEYKREVDEEIAVMVKEGNEELNKIVDKLKADAKVPKGTNVNLVGRYFEEAEG